MDDPVPNASLLLMMDGWMDLVYDGTSSYIELGFVALLDI